MNDRAPAARRSVLYHQWIADRLGDHPEWIETARARLTSDRVTHPDYRAAWLAWLDLPVEALRARLVADDEQARTLRSCSPFAGLLPPAERWRLFRSAP